MGVYHISARFVARPPVNDWREQLAVRLGGRPRRLGRWAELGLYGALECLDIDGESTLTHCSALVLSSQHGPVGAMRSALAQAREDLPLPLTFLQTQPSQLLAALSAQLRWCGDARFIAHANPLRVLALALVMTVSRDGGLLLGWVDELETESSIWLRLRPAVDPGGAWREASDFEMLLRHASHVSLESSYLKVIIPPDNLIADQAT
jgi:hypothetical protein